MRTLLTAAALALIGLAPAFAAAPETSGAPSQPAAANACAKPLPGAAGEPITFTAPLSEADRVGVSAAVFLALSDSSGEHSWPEPEIAAAAACDLARFDADGLNWTVSAGEGRVPPRWARAAGREDYLFLALGPSPDEARAWFLQGASATLTVKRPTYYLVAAAPGMQVVFRAYDGPPGAPALIEDMKTVLGGRAGALAMYDTRGDAVTVALATRSGVRAQLFGASAGATLYGPDGKYFTPVGDETVQMRASGFRCATAFGRLSRFRLMVIDGSDAALDLGCSFAAGGSWITLFVTRAEQLPPVAAIYRDRLQTAQKEGGVGRRLPPPAGAVPAADHGETWIDRAGAGQGLWLTRRGPYVVEARATFLGEDLEQIYRAVGEIAEAARTQIADGAR